MDNRYYCKRIRKFLKDKVLHDIISFMVLAFTAVLSLGPALLVIGGESALLNAVKAAFILCALCTVKCFIPLTKLDKMKSALGISTDDELEEYLRKCQCINENAVKSKYNRTFYINNLIFLSQEHIIDFTSCSIIPLKDIKAVKPFQKHMFDESDGILYGMKIKTVNRKKHRIFFDTEDDRNSVQKRISTAAEFAEGQKYIS